MKHWFLRSVGKKLRRRGRKCVMRPLYEIDEEFYTCFDEETGELLDEEKLNDLQMERDAKIEGVGLAVKNLEAYIVACEAEKETFDKNIARAKKQIKGYKHWLADATKGQKFSTPRLTISSRPSESVNILDEKLIPAVYIKWKSASTVDKVKIKQAIKAGFQVDGAELVQNRNVQVK